MYDTSPVCQYQRRTTTNNHQQEHLTASAEHLNSLEQSARCHCTTPQPRHKPSHVLPQAVQPMHNYIANVSVLSVQVGLLLHWITHSAALISSYSCPSTALHVSLSSIQIPSTSLDPSSLTLRPFCFALQTQKKKSNTPRHIHIQTKTCQMQTCQEQTCTNVTGSE